MASAPVHIIRQSELGRDINRPEVADQDVSEFLGGVAIVLDNMNPAPTLSEIEQRIERTSMQPEFEQLGHRQLRVIGLETAGPDMPSTEGKGNQTHYRSAVVVAASNRISYMDNPDQFTQREGLAQTEWNLVSRAIRDAPALGSVTNFSSQVSKTMQQQAISAMLLSLLAVVAYIWFRFGSIQYGLAAIIALVHDVAITLGALALCGYIANTAFGQALLLDPFRINLAIIAALLTIVGYSLNDTIVVFDRIRENRGRLAVATPAIINDSINQTISRTVLTSGTTLLAVAVLYVFGGGGVHGFAFSMLIGVIVGTYSSIAVASPILLLTRSHRQAAAREAERKQHEKGTSTAPAT